MKRWLIPAGLAVLIAAGVATQLTGGSGDELPGYRECSKFPSVTPPCVVVDKYAYLINRPEYSLVTIVDDHLYIRELRECYGDNFTSDCMYSTYNPSDLKQDKADERFLIRLAVIRE